MNAINHNDEEPHQAVIALFSNLSVGPTMHFDCVGVSANFSNPKPSPSFANTVNGFSRQQQTTTARGSSQAQGSEDMFDMPKTLICVSCGDGGDDDDLSDVSSWSSEEEGEDEDEMESGEQDMEDQGRTGPPANQGKSLANAISDPGLEEPKDFVFNKEPVFRFIVSSTAACLQPTKRRDQFYWKVQEDSGTAKTSERMAQRVGRFISRNRAKILSAKHFSEHRCTIRVMDKDPNSKPVEFRVFITRGILEKDCKEGANFVLLGRQILVWVVEWAKQTLAFHKTTTEPLFDFLSDHHNVRFQQQCVVNITEFLQERYFSAC